MNLDAKSLEITCHSSYILFGFQTELTMMDIQSLQAHSSSDLEQKDQRIEDLLRVCLLTIYCFRGSAVA